MEFDRNFQDSTTQDASFMWIKFDRVSMRN